MTAIVQLDDYLRRVEQRLRFLTASRGAAVTALAALLLTLVIVWISNQYRFVENVVWPLRLLLFCSACLRDSLHARDPFEEAQSPIRHQAGRREGAEFRRAAAHCARAAR